MGCSGSDAAAGEFSGAAQAIRSITKAEGFRGLFAGYGSFLLRDLPFDAIEFVAYEQLKKSYKASLTEVREPNSLETSAIGPPPPPSPLGVLTFEALWSHSCTLAEFARRLSALPSF